MALLCQAHSLRLPLPQHLQKLFIPTWRWVQPGEGPGEGPEPPWLHFAPAGENVTPRWITCKANKFLTCWSNGCEEGLRCEGWSASVRFAVWGVKCICAFSGGWLLEPRCHTPRCLVWSGSNRSRPCLFVVHGAGGQDHQSRNQSESAYIYTYIHIYIHIYICVYIFISSPTHQ